MSAALAAPSSLQWKRFHPAQHLRKSLGHRGGRKRRPLASPGHFGGPNFSGWDGRRKGDTLAEAATELARSVRSRSKMDRPWSPQEEKDEGKGGCGNERDCRSRPVKVCSPGQGKKVEKLKLRCAKINQNKLKN